MQPAHTTYSLRTTLERFVEPCILLLLLKEKSHGYDLVQRLEQEFKHRINTGSLYRTLNKMKKAGLIEHKRSQSTIGPTKKIYQITLSGKLALDTWMAALDDQLREIQLLQSKYKSLHEEPESPNTVI